MPRMASPRSGEACVGWTEAQGARPLDGVDFGKQEAPTGIVGGQVERGVTRQIRETAFGMSPAAMAAWAR